MRYLDRDPENNVSEDHNLWLRIKPSFDIRSKTYLQKTLDKYA